MIQQLAQKYQRSIARFLLGIFYVTTVLPSYGMASRYVARYYYTAPLVNKHHSANSGMMALNKGNVPAAPVNREATGNGQKRVLQTADIGGPSQPEMSSFKPVGTDNMVNLFSGDFNYNIPLLDVGGYPVNIFYDGGISMEQEASWVGLGWNINPGNINRNTRGVPDDFDGTDTLVEQQQMKKNITWGASIGTDLEVIGIKAPINANVGISFNNYLGPSLDLSARNTTGFKLASKATAEKSPYSISPTVGVDISSRSGTSFSASASFSANAFQKHSESTFGIGLATGYSSRSGIKALQIYEQTSFNSTEGRKGKGGGAGQISERMLSTSISFLKPSYTPTIRMPLTNTAIAGNFQAGTGLFGLAADIELEVYEQQSEIAAADMTQRKPMVGYLYYQNAMNNASAVMDFTRFNDREVTPNTPVISAPQYSYDVFSIQGEGTGGSIRAYRNDLGYVRDNVVVSQDKNTSLGADIDPAGHYGVNVNTIHTPSTIGEWGNGNLLRSAIPFRGSDSTWENVYFRNPGESSVLSTEQFTQIGGTNLVRFALGGSGSNPTVLPVLQRFNTLGKMDSTLSLLTPAPTERKKRTQVINMLTAKEASAIGLDKSIKSYRSEVLDGSNNLVYDTISRVSGYRKAHHISQVNVTEANGKRYIYGIPVYNIVQKDFTFSVDQGTLYTDTERVAVTDNGWMTTGSSLLSNSSSHDGYVQITQTPAYAHSFLLSGLLSPDYVDVTGDGITDDDLGDAVKFNYTRIKDAAQLDGWAVHQWRTPLSSGNQANFNAGNRSEFKDDKGIVSYGTRESWYVHSIESKTMIAVFTLSNRYDGKGANSENGDINSGDTSLKKLDRIDLYSKSDLKANGLAKAKPIKTVHFAYSYQLCQHTPDNPSGDGSSHYGKLTLDSIWFTFNGRNRANKNKYVFAYTNSDGSGNPEYALDAADRWGTYKPFTMNPSRIKNNDYPYSIQDASQKSQVDQNAGAWMLKKILLPSGGQLEVNYETDDYAYVQDRHATDMMRIVGFGNSSNVIAPALYGGNSEGDYVFVRVPVACATATDVYQKYLVGNAQLSFKIAVRMPKGMEYLTSYASIDGNNYGVTNSDHNVIWFKLTDVDGHSPLSLTALEYLREQLPGQAYTGYDVSGEPALAQVGSMLMGMLDGILTAFSDPINTFRADGKAKYVDTSRCFVRLNDPDGFKYGGGYRVKSVLLKDNWTNMTGNQFTSTYGQLYDYTTTETYNGVQRTISSGVASYEPSIGGEENPFQTIIQVEDKLPLGPTSYGSVEMPVLDAFFPSASVGYSKVTVRAYSNNADPSRKSRSGIGKQVTEYYTAKDFPVYYSYTSLDPASDKEFHQSSTTIFLSKYAYDYKALSQGFLVATNDMHGKMKSQSSYAENDSATRISYTENFYRNTGANGLNETFQFAGNTSGGAVTAGNMGVDIELMTDAREFSVKSSSEDVQGQADLFYIPFPVPIVTVWPVSGVSENSYRAVTTTKVISYHAVLDSVLVIDKGSAVSTKNLVFDAGTGAVVVNRTNNEFNKPIYTTSYPAYWAYSGMGLAYQNIDAVYTGINFSQGKITNAAFNSSIFESGDELYLFNPGSTPASGCDAGMVSPDAVLLWAFDKNKNTTALTTTSHDFVFMTDGGGLYTKAGVSFRIVRSGKRNMLDAKAAGITGMLNPIVAGKITIDSTSKTISASAAEFREKWQTDNDIINKYSPTYNSGDCSISDLLDCSSVGVPEKSINPYRKGLVGNFRSYRSLVFYNTRKETDPSVATNIAQNGFMAGFSPYWNFNGSNNLVPDTTNAKWVWNNQLTKVNARGLELETKNALNIYTAAQYGFTKTMPVAITNNARYTETGYEGFEDVNYSERLELATGVTGSCDPKLVNFGNVVPETGRISLHGYIVNTDTMLFSAHTGKYAMVVPAGITLDKQFTTTTVADSFSLLLNQDTVRTLTTPGVNFNPFFKFPSGLGLDTTLSTTSPFLDTVLFNLSVQPSGPIVIDSVTPGGTYTRVEYQYDDTLSFYVNITTGGTYTVESDFNSGAPGFGNSSMGFKVFSSEGAVITPSPTSGSISDSIYSICLPVGVYKISCYPHNMFNYLCEQGGPGCLYTEGSALPGQDFAFKVSRSGIPNLITYRNQSAAGGCVFTDPMAATNAMYNSVFNVPAGKKMVFSAWVHEDCGNADSIPCRDTTFSHNHVNITFGDNTSTSLYPSGPIVDGWQRYEGYFIAPVAGALKIGFVNTNTRNIYFDDIRLHPFNADMKSYVYDPISLRLIAELDANNYATYYEYDEEGTLVRTKAETREGIKMIKETRSAKQKKITEVQ